MWSGAKRPEGMERSVTRSSPARRGTPSPITHHNSAHNPNQNTASRKTHKNRKSRKNPRNRKSHENNRNDHQNGQGRQNRQNPNHRRNRKPRFQLGKTQFCQVENKPKKLPTESTPRTLKTIPSQGVARLRRAG